MCVAVARACTTRRYARMRKQTHEFCVVISVHAHVAIAQNGSIKEVYTLILHCTECCTMAQPQYVVIKYQGSFGGYLKIDRDVDGKGYLQLSTTLPTDPSICE